MVTIQAVHCDEDPTTGCRDNSLIVQAPKKAKKTKQQLEEERRQAEEAARLAEEGVHACKTICYALHCLATW